MRASRGNMFAPGGRWGRAIVARGHARDGRVAERSIRAWSLPAGLPPLRRVKAPPSGRRLESGPMDTTDQGPQAVFRARGLTRTYRMGDVEVHALRGVELDLHEGAIVVLLGASGSGKSTLLNILGGLDAPTPRTSTTGHDRRT